MEKHRLHLICVSELMKEELSVTSNGTNLFFILTVTISGNLIIRSIFSSVGYVCDLFLLIAKINLVIIIILTTFSFLL